MARQSDESYVYEDVLRAKLETPACLSNSGPNPLVATPSINRVLFVVMCSTDRPQHVADMVAGWGHWVPPENVILLCGGKMPGLNVTLLPRLAAEDGVDAKFGYQPANLANLRQVQSMWWLANTYRQGCVGQL